MIEVELVSSAYAYELKEIESEVRKVLPKLRQLSEGSKVKFKDNNHNGIYIGRFSEGYVFHNLDLNRLQVAEIDEINIVGREIMLSDVLQAIKLWEFGVDYIDLNTGLLMKTVSNNELTSVTPVHYDLKIDVSKSKLRDQPESFIYRVHSLIRSRNENKNR